MERDIAFQTTYIGFLTCRKHLTAPLALFRTVLTSILPLTTHPQLVSSIVTLAGSAATLVFLGPFAVGLVGAIGLGVFAGATGFFMTILFMIGARVPCMKR